VIRSRFLPKVREVKGTIVWHAIELKSDNVCCICNRPIGKGSIAYRAHYWANRLCVACVMEMLRTHRFVEVT